ncbi:hypothetical protein HYH02_007557 [Chlamydomonas schloesseri]|uniref:Uncharacterized protein n=1 Tax=Chlamydomonas schloesseri TaxID=2026947 RepID=A0A836B574_9CHLO|nr:hypothetical protein HYH02_007557 [Chlamydomonas schloesseri]|eukprot:KAG2447639.1 hypothetical protein HYH02_007557 [Chlamydomonas schloesseri]
MDVSMAPYKSAYVSMVAVVSGMDVSGQAGARGARQHQHDRSNAASDSGGEDRNAQLDKRIEGIVDRKLAEFRKEFRDDMNKFRDDMNTQLNALKVAVSGQRSER